MSSRHSICSTRVKWPWLEVESRVIILLKDTLNSAVRKAVPFENHVQRGLIYTLLFKKKV